MDKYNLLEEHYKLLEYDENHIEYFVSFLHNIFRENMNESKKIIDKILDVGEKLNSQLVKAWAYFYLGWYQHDICNYDEAMKSHMIAKDLFLEIDNTKGIVFSYNALMADYMQIGLYDLAIETGIIGINKGQESNNVEFISALLINIIICYIRFGLYNEARKSINYLDVLSLDIGIEGQIILNYSKAELELNNNNIEKATYYINEAYKNVMSSDGEVLLDEVLNIRGRIYVQKNEFFSAEEDFELALKLAQERSSMDVASHILKEWAVLLMKKNQLKDSKKKLLEALKICKQINYRVVIGDIYKLLADIYKSEEDYRGSTEALELYHKYDKELFNKQNNFWIRKLQDNQIKREAETYKTLYNEIALISSIGQKVTSDLNMENIVKILYDGTKNIINLDILGVLLYKEEEGIVDCSYFMENGERFNAGEISVHDKSSYIAYCINNQQSVMINDNEREYVKYIAAPKPRRKLITRLPESLLYCPLVLGKKVTGVLSVQCYEKNMYSIDDLNKLKILASYLSIAIENSKLFKEVEFFANHDYLTGCYNRKVILDKGEEAFYKLNRYGEKFSIIMGDVDNFKTINDRFGHLAGDKALRVVSNIIKNNLRTSDYVGRYGGEEFLIVLPNTDIVGAESLAERIRSEISESTIEICSNESLNVSISLGIYEFDENTKSLDHGIAAADKVLYKAKRLGKNRIEIYDKKNNF